MTKEMIPSTEIITPLIKMFKMCPVCSASFDTDKKIGVFKKSLGKGYLVDPLCLNEYSKAFIKSIDMQYNSTFYKTWVEVTDKSRRELLFDQILHYVTTYGTDFSLEGTGYEYIPNTNPEEPAWNTYKVITPCTFEDLYVKCMNMICSGVALKSNTVKVLTDYIVVYAKYNNVIVDVDSIKNREALVIICDAFGVLPKDAGKLFAHIIYKTTGETMIIKNRDMRARIINKVIGWSNSAVINLWKSLNEDQLIALAGVFNRYKELFLSFKCNKSLVPIINKISRLSKKHHKPMQRGYWETVLNEPLNIDKLKKEAYKATNFKLLQVMQSIRERLLMAAGQGDNMHIVRNGKVYITDNEYAAIDSRYFTWEDIYNVCKEQLISNLSKKACTVKLPEQYVLACPTSEKNFIGDFPMGSYCQLGKDSVMGIYWKNDWGTRDFDLSFNTIDGTRIGWNSDYYTEDRKVIYSGDITNAPDGANEVIYFNSNDIPTGIVNINRYSGMPGSKYKLFFGTEQNIDIINKNYCSDSYFMVDPNKVQLEADITQNDASEQMVGMTFDGRFFFYSLSTGYTRVTSAIMKKNNKNHKHDYDNTYQDHLKNASNEMTEILKRKMRSTIFIKDILTEAGFEIVDNDPEIDLTNIDRSTLIELFS